MSEARLLKSENRRLGIVRRGSSLEEEDRSAKAIQRVWQRRRLIRRAAETFKSSFQGRPRQDAAKGRLDTSSQAPAGQFAPLGVC
jgi:hypothetical protein